MRNDINVINNYNFNKLNNFVTIEIQSVFA